MKIEMIFLAALLGFSVNSYAVQKNEKVLLTCTGLESFQISKVQMVADKQGRYSKVLVTNSDGSVRVGSSTVWAPDSAHESGWTIYTFDYKKDTMTEYIDIGQIYYYRGFRGHPPGPLWMAFVKKLTPPQSKTQHILNCK